MVTDSPPETELISVREAMNRAGVSRPTIHRWFKRGILTKYRRGLQPQRVWVDADELRRALEARPVSPEDRWR